MTKKRYVLSNTTILHSGQVIKRYFIAIKGGFIDKHILRSEYIKVSDWYDHKEDAIRDADIYAAHNTSKVEYETGEQEWDYHLQQHVHNAKKYTNGQTKKNTFLDVKYVDTNG